MPDEPEIIPLHFTQTIVRLVSEWPALTEISPLWLISPHAFGATLDGDTLVINAANGTATYHLLRDRRHGQNIVAELVEGDSPAKLKQMAKKYGPKD